MTHEDLQQIPEDLRELFALLDEQGWNPQLHDTPVPYYDSKVPCGNPADLPDGIPDGYMLLPRGVSGIEARFGVSVRGDSMIDAGIEDGDELDVQATPVAEDGDIVVAVVEGETTVKMFFTDNYGRHWLVPCNTKYQPMLLEKYRDAYVAGRVVKVHKNARRGKFRELNDLVTQSPDYMLPTEQADAQSQADRGSRERVARAVARAFDGIASVTSTDWIATYHVLTTYAKAPTSYSAFAEWANALGVEGMPPCKPDLLRKADGVYSQPLYRWEECTSVRESTLQRRLQIARTLKQQLA